MRHKIKNNFPFLKDQNRFVYIFLTLPLLQILTKIFNKKKRIIKIQYFLRDFVLYGNLFYQIKWVKIPR